MSPHQVRPQELNPQDDRQRMRQEIRAQMRQARQALSDAEQSQASAQLSQQIQKIPQWQTANTIALYLSFQGEIDTRPLIEDLWQQGKQVVVPVLHPFSKGHLLFLRYRPDTKMRVNKFNIAEPVLDQTQIIPLQHIDIIATPLVAFDKQGNRLGMGGGFYDRTLDILDRLDSLDSLDSLEKYSLRSKSNKPLLIGLAHDLQCVEQLPTQDWDQPLDKIITPKKIWTW